MFNDNVNSGKTGTLKTLSQRFKIGYSVIDNVNTTYKLNLLANVYSNIRVSILLDLCLTLLQMYEYMSMSYQTDGLHSSDARLFG